MTGKSVVGEVKEAGWKSEKADADAEACAFRAMLIPTGASRSVPFVGLQQCSQGKWELFGNITLVKHAFARRRGASSLGEKS